MNMQMLVHIGLHCMYQIMKLFILTVLVLNIFLKKSEILLGIKTKTNIFRIEANNLIRCRYFCVKFIEFILKGKNLIDFTTPFSHYDFERKDDIILNYFK